MYTEDFTILELELLGEGFPDFPQKQPLRYYNTKTA